MNNNPQKPSTPASQPDEDLPAEVLAETSTNHVPTQDSGVATPPSDGSAPQVKSAQADVDETDDVDDADEAGDDAKSVDGAENTDETDSGTASTDETDEADNADSADEADGDADNEDSSDEDGSAEADDDAKSVDNAENTDETDEADNADSADEADGDADNEDSSDEDGSAEADDDAKSVDDAENTDEADSGTGGSTDESDGNADSTDETDGDAESTDEADESGDDAKSVDDAESTDESDEADSADSEGSAEGDSASVSEPVVGDGSNAPDATPQQSAGVSGGAPQQAVQGAYPGGAQLSAAPYGAPQQPNYSGYGVAASEQPAGKKSKNVVGIVALVLAVIGLILGLVPGVMVLGWFLMFAGLVTGVVGLFQQNKEKVTSIIAMALSVLGGIASGIILLVTLLSGAVAAGDSQAGEFASASWPASEASDAVAGADAGGASVLDGVLKFGETAEFDDGLKFTIGEPRTDYTPSDYAKSSDPAMQNYLVFTVTIENNTDAPYDPYPLITGNSGGKEVEKIYDSAKGINGPASSKLLPGEKVSFDMAVAVADPSSVTLDVSVDFDHEDILYTNK